MKTQSGSAIFIILIAIALFAALAMAISQSLRVSGGAPTKNSKEKLDLQVIELSQFLEAMKLRFTKLTVADKIPTLNISFQSDVYKRTDGTPMCMNDNSNCTGPACMMFSPYAPDGVRPYLFTEIASSRIQTQPLRPVNGAAQIGQLSIDGVGTSKQELLVHIVGVNAEFCNHYNSKLGLTTTYTEDSTLGDIGETVLTSGGSTWGDCSGPAAFDGTDVFGEQATMFSGKTNFCAPMKGAFLDIPLGIVYVLEAR